jgi:hypothetical protein
MATWNQDPIVETIVDNPHKPTGGAVITCLQCVSDPAKPGIVHWTSTGAAPDTAGAFYPGPGPFGGTSNFVFEGSW